MGWEVGVTLVALRTGQDAARPDVFARWPVDFR